MSVPRKRKRNPHPHVSTARRTLSAIGLGLGVGSTALALGTIYQRPSVSIGGVVLGLGLAAFHLPWGEIGREL